MSKRFVLAFCIALPLLLILTSFARSQNSRAASAASYRQRGDQWLAQGEPDRAIKDYNLALAFAPESATTYIQRGVARYDKGDLDGAMEDYSRAITLDPQIPRA